MVAVQTTSRPWWQKPTNDGRFPFDFLPIGHRLLLVFPDDFTPNPETPGTPPLCGAGWALVRFVLVDAGAPPAGGTRS